MYRISTILLACLACIQVSCVPQHDIPDKGPSDPPEELQGADSGEKIPPPDTDQKEAGEIQETCTVLRPKIRISSKIDGSVAPAGGKLEGEQLIPVPEEVQSAERIHLTKVQLEMKGDHDFDFLHSIGVWIGRPVKKEPEMLTAWKRDVPDDTQKFQLNVDGERNLAKPEDDVWGIHWETTGRIPSTERTAVAFINAVAMDCPS